MTATTTRITAATFAALLLAGCAGDQLSFGNPAPAVPQNPTVNMGGRWLLAAPGAPACGMFFAAAPRAEDGTIAPEGGCPGDFFTSRHWTFERGQLVIKDHKNEPLGQLAFNNGQFQGKSTAGTPITLYR